MPAPITRERIEHALDLLAGIIAGSSDDDAARAAPIYERLENELKAFDERNDVQARARARLTAARRDNATV